ncbi:MAG: hypothetical protein AAF205_11685, partial [Pseudomonadota bacterium]
IDDVPEAVIGNVFSGEADAQGQKAVRVVAGGEIGNGIAVAAGFAARRRGGVIAIKNACGRGRSQQRCGGGD